MNFLIVGLLAAGYLLAGSAPASAAPLILAALAIPATATAIAVTNLIISVALTVGSTLIRSALAGKKKAQVQAASGVRQDVQFGADVYFESVFGQRATPGHFVYHNTSGTDNKRLDRVYVIGNGWHKSLEGLWVNGSKRALTSVDSGIGWTKYAVTLDDDAGTRRLWVTFWEGRHDQGANATLVETANPSGRWTEDHIGVGVCYVHVEADYVSGLEDFRGYPDFLFEVKGLRLYDLRKDSTASGSGDHRFDDWETWEYSGNPSVCAYHFMRGYFINGERVLGMAAQSYDLLAAHFIAASNICDESVTLDSGFSEPRYRVAWITSDGDEYWSTIQALADAMAGSIVERGGIFSVAAGVAQSSVGTISDSDLLESTAVEFNAHRSRTDLVNEIWGQYSNPDNKYDAGDYPPLIGSGTDKDADGGDTLPVDRDFRQVTSVTQAQRLARILYRRNRFQATATITLGLDALKYEPGDWVVWESVNPARGTRTWEITGWHFDMVNDRITLSLQEIAASVFAWSASDEVAPAPVPTPPSPAARISTVGGLTLQAATSSGSDGQLLPAIDVSWSAITDNLVSSVTLEHRIRYTTAATRVEVARPAGGEVWEGTTLSGGFMAGTDYEVRATITTADRRSTTWTPWSAVLTDGDYVVPSAAGVLDGVISAASLGDGLATAIDRASSDSIQALIDAQENGEAVLVNVLDGNDQAAIVNRVSTTQDGHTATLTELVESVNGLSLNWSLTGTIDGSTGAVVFSGTKRADGVGASYSFGIYADQFFIAPPEGEGGVPFSPFLFSEGVLYVSQAVIPEISADKVRTGRIESTNGLTYFDLDSGELVITSVAP